MCKWYYAVKCVFKLFKTRFRSHVDLLYSRMVINDFSHEISEKFHYLRLKSLLCGAGLGRYVQHINRKKENREQQQQH